MTAPRVPEGFQAIRSPADSMTMRLICARPGCHASTTCLHPETPHALAFIAFHQELHA